MTDGHLFDNIDELNRYSKMWKKLKDTDYFLSCINRKEVFITDYVSIWSLQYSDKSFLRALKESNPILEMDEDLMMHEGTLILTIPERLKYARVKLEGNTLFVTLTKFVDYPLKLDMKLAEGTKEMFFQKVTKPLIQTVNDLKSSEQELRNLLLRKDKEIAEYKDEKGQIVFRSLKTEPFNEVNHRSKHKLYAEYFGESNLPESLLTKTVDVPRTDVKEEKPTAEELKRNSREVKSEPILNITTNDVKCEPNAVKSELSNASSIKTEAERDIRECLRNSSSINTKAESDNVKLEYSETQHHRVAASPSKRKKRKLNL